MWSLFIIIQVVLRQKVSTLTRELMRNASLRSPKLWCISTHQSQYPKMKTVSNIIYSEMIFWFFSIRVSSNFQLRFVRSPLNVNYKNVYYCRSVNSLIMVPIELVSLLVCHTQKLIILTWVWKPSDKEPTAGHLNNGVKGVQHNYDLYERTKIF